MKEVGVKERGREGSEGAWEEWRQSSNGVSLYDLDVARKRVRDLGTDRHEPRGALVGCFVV